MRGRPATTVRQIETLLAEFGAGGEWVPRWLLECAEGDVHSALYRMRKAGRVESKRWGPWDHAYRLVSS